MKRVLLVIALAGLGPMSIMAASSSAATAAVTAARTTPAAASPATGPSDFFCGLVPEIKPSGSNNGEPVYLVTSDGCLDGIHSCRVLNTYDGNQAVECTDIYVEADGERAVVIPVAEGYCQNTSTGNLVQCANVDIPFDLNSPQGNFGTANDICGHSAGSCDNPAKTQGRNEWLGDETTTPSSCNGAGSANEFWTVDLAGGTIELPGDVTFSSNSNLASQHAIICG